ncbi:MAG: winged helix-turn-helix domain-containing protein [Nitrososphaerales archaeon]|jgi:predicted transcriptional regulator
MSENLLNPATEKPLHRSELPEGRRSLLQIRVDILRVVMQGYGKPTQIMYKANLSWNVLQSQLRAFLETGLLSVEEYGSRHRYQITQEGAELVRSYQKVVDEILD